MFRVTTKAAPPCTAHAQIALSSDQATHRVPRICLRTLLPHGAVDDLPNGMASHTEPPENCFVFGKELIRYEPDEDSMLKPITKK